ncbi:hypothetical protein TARUN_6099 [Trichoderma arundinaceum]|uniref:F-box domain-containing protein n=1 Tax=Trichoderma arundinaceum TaxID=490622 RepID=A0A395NK30_TRIAR|nr:hypothetical protein TARUN_6099 [Trichoderma arundinaceum]
MDSLPFELVSQILNQLPPAEYKSARLTCHAFNDALAKPTFHTLASFIDPATAQNTIEKIAADLSRRPKAIWSPGCSVPKGLPVPESFLFAMHVALRGTPCPSPATSRASSISSASGAWSDGEDSDVASVEGEGVTAWNFGRSIGMDDVTEDTLRQALFRYALYLSYIYGGEGEAPQLWVMNSKRWEQHR